MVQPEVITETVKQDLRFAGRQRQTVYRYLSSVAPFFTRLWFDETALQQQGWLDGLADAGRGNTFYFTVREQPLVLRHFRRGGMMRHISHRRYPYQPFEYTRAVREFETLRILHESGLPVPKPYACQVQFGWLSYQASLVMQRLPGDTLATRFLAGRLSDTIWEQVGRVLASFHAAGVYHADLNAHNILIDSLQRVSLLDFDRARLRATPKKRVLSSWPQKNLQRLHRSLTKISQQSDDVPGCMQSLETGFPQLQHAWQRAFQSAD